MSWQFDGFTLEPSELRRTSAGPSDQRVIGEMLERSGFVKHVPPHRGVRVEIENPVPAGVSLVNAHGDWGDDYFREIKTPEGLPRQPDDSVTPDGLVKLAVQCVAEGSGGMSSHYGFVGHYFSMLASPVHGIWDVRGEAAKCPRDEYGYHPACDGRRATTPQTRRSAASRRIGQIVFYVGVIGFVIALFMIPTDGHGSRIRSTRDMWFFGLGMASAVVIWIGLQIQRKSRPLKSP